MVWLQSLVNLRNWTAVRRGRENVFVWPAWHNPQFTLLCCGWQREEGKAQPEILSNIKSRTHGATSPATLRAARLEVLVTRCNLLRAMSQKKNSILLLQLLRATLQEKLHHVSGALTVTQLSRCHAGHTRSLLSRWSYKILSSSSTCCPVTKILSSSSTCCPVAHVHYSRRTRTHSELHTQRKKLLHILFNNTVTILIVR